MAFVSRGNPSKDLGGLLDRRCLEIDDRKAPDDPAVAVVDLADALRGCCGDDPDFASRQEGLQELAHARALDALTEERVEILHDEDILSVGGASEFVDQRFQALLDLATELGARDEGAGVELKETRAREVSRHVAPCDSIREATDQRRLAHAGLAHDEGVVLEPPLQRSEAVAAPPDRAQ